MVGGKSELRQQRTSGLLQDSRALGEDLEPGPLVSKGVPILIHEPDADSGAEMTPACGEGIFADQGREQGGLPAPVGARDQKAIAPPNLDVERAHAEVLAFDDRRLESRHDVRTPEGVAEGQLESPG